MGAMENEQTTPETYIDGQIAKLKEQGVTFGICAEAEARDYLAEKCPPCKTCSYARLFDTYSEGESEGKYIELDFGQLRYLADIDQRLREILLNMTLDVEHFCKTKLMTMCAVTEEEGRAIISQYMGSLDGERRQRIESELARHDGHSCGGTSDGNNGDVTLWAFLDAVSFGTLLGIVHYCGKYRIGSQKIADYSALHAVKTLRNTCAHGSCILAETYPRADGKRVAPHEVSNAVAAVGVSRRLRRRWLQTAPVAQIASTLCLYAEMVPKGGTRTKRIRELQHLLDSVERESVIPAVNPAMAALAFTKRLTEAFRPVE